MSNAVEILLKRDPCFGMTAERRRGSHSACLP
jgi:hypothetical protein